MVGWRLEWNGIDSTPRRLVPGDDSDAGLQMQDARAGAGSAASVVVDLVVVVVRGSVERCPRRQRRLVAPNGDGQQSLMNGDGSNEANPSSPRRWNRFPSTGDLVRGEKLGPWT
ncbi:hypothetical protein THAR02_04713 [Trichoderma harzianum]|uniref:Uncharacterized protein n=1 Tax=Trichoderma harzianum TaxID=5544 RepID=A0A0G0ADV4_TRIHA|nr:hypothetical protein THAR02_04713 [Trichoderma harzianum]